MTNHEEDKVLAAIEYRRKKHWRTAAINKPLKAAIYKVGEYDFQISVAEFLDLSLTPQVTKWTSHEVNIPLGLIRPKKEESVMRRACIQFFNDIVGGAIKKMLKRGFKKSWADVLIHYRHATTGAPSSLWLELKSKDGKIQPHQIIHAEDLGYIGIATEFPRSLEDIQKALVKHGVPHRKITLF